jgi:hypothetical protein
MTRTHIRHFLPLSHLGKMIQVCAFAQACLHSHRTFNFRGPKNSKVLLFPYREICNPQILSPRSPLLCFRRIRTHSFASPTVRCYTLRSPRSDVSVKSLTFPLSGLLLYCGFALSRLHYSRYQIPGLPTPDT